MIKQHTLSGLQSAIKRMDAVLQPAATAYADAVFDSTNFDLTGAIRDLHWNGEELSPEDASKQIELVPDYNAFNGPALAKFIRIHAAKFRWLRFAREYSCALYFRAKNDMEAHEIGEGLKNTFQADEFSIHDNVVRLWWD